MIELSYPWLLLLLTLPPLIHYFLPAYKESRDALLVPFFRHIVEASGETPRTGATVTQRSRWQWLMITSGWLALCLTLAKPVWVGEPIEVKLAAREILVAVDLSRSMYEEDFINQAGEKMNRLQGVKEMMAQFVQQRQHDRLGLVLFADKPYLQAPFTDNVGTWLTLLTQSELGMAGSMTAIGDAIGLSIKVFEQAKTQNRVLILVTDGQDTASMVPPVAAAQIAADKGIRIHTIAIGDPGGPRQTQPNFTQLAEISLLTGGSDFRAADRNQLLAINAELNRIEQTAFDSLSFRPRSSLHHWPISIWVCMMLVGIFLAELRHRWQWER